MKTKHTPGNWQTMNSHKPGFMDIVSLGDDQPQNRKWICEIGPSDTTEEDASLIASAPEMLEALRCIVSHLDPDHDHPKSQHVLYSDALSPDDDDQTVVEWLKGIISKATE